MTTDRTPAPADGVAQGDDPPRTPGRSGTSLARNFSALTAANLTARLASLVTALALARMLGPHEYGIYTFAGSILVLVLALSDFGLSPYLTREVALDRRQLDAELRRLLALRGTVALLGFGSFAAVAVMNPTSELVVPMLLLFASMTADSLNYLGFAYLQGLERMQFEAVATTSMALARAAGSVGIAFVTDSLSLVLSWFVLTGLAQILWTARTVLGERRRLLAAEAHLPRPSPRPLTAFTRSGAAMMLAAGFTTIILRADSVIIGFTLGSLQVGFYTAAYAIATGFQVIPVVMATASYPRLARGLATDRNVFTATLSRGLQSALLLCIPIAILCCAFARDIVALVYGEAFTASAAPLQLLIWWVPLTAVTLLAASTARALGRERMLAAVLGAAAALNISVNLLVVPAYGLVGAAVVTIVLEGGILAALGTLLRHHFQGVATPGIVFRSFFALGVLAAAAFTLAPRTGFLPGLAGSLSAYLLAVAALGLVHRSHLGSLRRLLGGL